MRMTKKLICSIFLGIIVGIAGSGCSSTMPPVNSGTTTQPATTGTIDESFDPVLLNDDNLSFPEAASISTPTIDNNQTNTDNQDTKVFNKPVDGFRIQIFATKDIEVATLQKKEAEYEFANDGIAVYIEFDSPLYKLRVGDCTTREEAEQLHTRIKQRGFSTSFVVKTKVNTVPVLPELSAPETPEALPRDN